jgi:holo-[acyl-carrier protein] synthase
MIVGIGTDLVDIPRIAEFAARWGEDGLRRIFSDAELAYCLALSDPAPSLAARFAAKEAFFKAMGCGWGEAGAWSEIEVRRDPSGRPTLALAGRAAASAESGGAARIHLSLTHATGVAGAVVVLEG